MAGGGFWLQLVRMLLPFLLLLICLMSSMVEGLGVNWGTMEAHQLPPKIVVQMLQDNGIKKVKLFDYDPSVMSALAGSGIEVMVAIPNKDLQTMNDYDSAKQWVRNNVNRYLFSGGVDIKYVAVGNEPFLQAYNGSFLNNTLPALQNIQNALNDAGLGSTIKATVPFNADVYESPRENPIPSAGRFRPDISSLMAGICGFLHQNSAPFVTNIYPFLSLYLNKDFPFDFAFFDGTASPVMDTNGIRYNNVFEANFDTLVSALKGLNLETMPIIVGEIGWPTDGDINANVANAQKFYSGLLKRIAANTGTPLRPNQYIEMYLFGLIDEDAKSIDPGSFERHWGIFRYDGQPKFPMDLTGQGSGSMLVGAKNVRYLPQSWCVFNPGAKDLSKLGDSITFACTRADCTALGYGSSCNGLDTNGNASYAFNMYYQNQDQNEESCDFGGLAMVTTQNASTGTCNFIVQIDVEASSSVTVVWPLFLAGQLLWNFVVATVLL